MRKKIICISLCFLFVLSCTVAKQPTFIGVKNIKIVNSNIKFITLSADALFINPNTVGGTLKTNNLKVYVNAIEIATLTTKAFNVPSKKEFKIPLIINFSTDKIIDNKNIQDLLGSLISQRLKIQYKGKIDYTVLGYSSSYDVNKVEELKIKF